LVGDASEIDVRRERSLRLESHETILAPRDDQQAVIGKPIDAERKLEGCADHDLAAAIRIHGDNLSSAPVREPEPILVPAWRLTHGEPGDQSDNVRSHHLTLPRIEARHAGVLTVHRATVNYGSPR